MVRTSSILQTRLRMPYLYTTNETLYERMQFYANKKNPRATPMVITMVFLLLTSNRYVATAPIDKNTNQPAFTCSKSMFEICSKLIITTTERCH